MKCVENNVFSEVWSKNFHILTRSWMRDWTWTNDNNKHKHKNSDSVNFSMMIKLKEGMYHIFKLQQIKSIWNFSFMVSHTDYFKGVMVFTLTSQMYHIISVLVPVLVRIPEYLSTSTSTSTMTLELTSTVRVPEIQYSSTSTEYEYPSPAPSCPVSTGKLRRWYIKRVGGFLWHDSFDFNCWYEVAFRIPIYLWQMFAVYISVPYIIAQ